jgi:hypothetical protein
LPNLFLPNLARLYISGCTWCHFSSERPLTSFEEFLQWLAAAAALPVSQAWLERFHQAKHICNICRCTIYAGTAWKCTVCADWDLCLKCYEAGRSEHHSHPLKV